MPFKVTAFHLVLASFLVTGCAVIKPVPEPAEAQKVESTRVSIVAVGDIMLGGKGRSRFEQEGYGLAFAGTRDILQAADITLGNLETSLTYRGEAFSEKQYLFRNAPDKVPVALKEAGFDLVSLANNHSMDYGVEGLVDTLAALNKAGIRYHGAGMNLSEARKAQLFTLSNGQTVGFLAYSNTFPEEFWATQDKAGTAFGHVHHLREDVASLVEQNIDVIIVSFHWGQERKTELRSYQPMLAHAAIDAGADVVIGHHPHILQAVERYKRGLILYSLGNFAFSTFSPHVNTSVIAKLEFEGGQFQALTLTPLDINNFRVQLQPKIVSGEAARAVYEELETLSAKRETSLQLRQDRIHWPGISLEVDVMND